MKEVTFPFEKYANISDSNSARLLYELFPELFDNFMDDIAFFEKSSKPFLAFLPNLFKFFSMLLPVAFQAKESSTVLEVQAVTQAVNELDEMLEQLELGIFQSTATLVLEEVIDEMNDKAISIDMQRYNEYFKTPLPKKVFDLFSSGEIVQGLPQSMQGTLAASEILSIQEFEGVLKRELNLVYPGSGGHLTPLLIAFDLFERNCIDAANLLFNDLIDYTDFISTAFKKFESMHIISNLQIESSSDGTKTRFVCTYNDKRICLEFIQANTVEIEDWKTNGRNPNVVYDHLPYQSAVPGAATYFFSTNDDTGLHGGVLHIIPTTTIPVSKVVGKKEVLSIKKRKNVSFADKNSWVVPGNKGVGVTVALIEHD